MPTNNQQPYLQPEDIPNLKRQYAKAVKANKETFDCYLVQGITHTFLTAYAKYLLEYLKTTKKKEAYLSYQSNEQRESDLNSPPTRDP